MDLPAQANVTKYLKMLITEQLKMLITEQLKMLMTVDLPAQTTLSTSAPSSAAVKASQAPNPQLHTSTQKTQPSTQGCNSPPQNLILQNLKSETITLHPELHPPSLGKPPPAQSLKQTPRLLPTQGSGLYF